MPAVAIVGDAIQTHGEVTFEWKICDFFSLSDKIDDYYLSPDFVFANTSWCLKLFPNGHDEESSAWVGIYLVRKDSGPLKTVNFSLGIKGHDDKVRGESDFLEKDDSWGFSKTWDRSYLKSLISTLIPNGVLIVTCDLRNNVHCADESALCNRVLKVISCMKTILTEGKRADFTLKLGDRKWPVHKVILENRCQYFENMFRHKWVEDTVGEVKFEDIEGHALDSVLCFIYTGDVQDMSVENVCDIYVAAHKFLLDDLKCVCIRWMKTNMCMDIICRALVIAHTYEEEELNESAVQYFIQEAGEILDSEEWKQLKKNHVSVVADLLEETTKREVKKRKK